jgi:GT2 family glycosyltransferase
MHLDYKDMQLIPSGYRIGNSQGKVRMREREEQKPRVLIASIVSNQAKWLHRFLDAVEGFEYPVDRLTFAFLTGNNDDKTFDILDEFEVTHQARISWDTQQRKERVWLKGDDVAWDGFHRFVKLAMLRNHLVADSLTDEEYVFVVDSDVVEMPTDLLSSLAALDADIAAPMVYIEDYEFYGNGFFYDSLAFRVGDVGFGHLPPYIPGCDSLPDHLTYVDSVGTCYLVNSKVFRAGVKYVGGESLSEQVGFCECAKAAGFRVAVAPDVSVLHCNFELYGERFKP